MGKSAKSKASAFIIFSLILSGLSCSGPESDQPLLTAEMPLHLEEHIGDAKIEGSEIGEDLLVPVEWRFNEEKPQWKPIKPIPNGFEAPRIARVDDGLRLHLNLKNRYPGGSSLLGAIFIELPNWRREDWAFIEIQVRSQDQMRNVGLAFNYTREDPLGGDRAVFPFYSPGDRTPLVTDGTVQTYRLSLDWPNTRRWDGPWTHLGIWCDSLSKVEEASLDILSVKIIPKEAIYADAVAGMQSVDRDQDLRWALYTHTPGRINYRVRIPQSGRLDFGLGVLREEAPVTFRVIASQRDEETVLFEETYSNPREWTQHSVDLSSFAGKTVNLTLEANAEPAGSVALWAAPTVSGVRSNQKPNVIFYVIDGAGADLMSVYGYNRRTTPYLERIAAEGAVFEWAYSNATWTRPSTLSFMTSLQHSVSAMSQGGGWPQAPDQVQTMAENVHRAGYQTAVLVSNSYAGRMSALNRGVDRMEDFDPENHATSSVYLHNDFWKWREEYPAEPYWVHFQTTDIHTPWRPVAPFAGLFISPMRRKAFDEEYKIVDRMPGPEDFEGTNIDRVSHFQTARGIYDEAMAHQDYQIGRFVERLKENGDWEHTLFIVAADHSHFHAGLSLLDPLPPELDTHTALSAPIMSSWISRVPMIFVWPGHIDPGMRFSDPVSMIDMLPTILDLTDLPMPEMMQGQSLAPLLLGEPGWEPRPVILDEVRVRRSTGEFRGRIEVIDGRWGASWYIHAYPEEDSSYLRKAPVLIYDLWNDPYCIHSLHEERPDLVDKYSKFLEKQWESHKALGTLFSKSKKEPLTPKQLENLRSLGYIR